jgi:4-methyl-5(b-hydroxyethyl)-thiazole monophosphate biosynthesis
MSLKGLMLIADDFEDTEALATLDVLERGGLVIVTATPNHDLDVISSHQLSIRAQIHFNDIFSEDYDFLVIPGGPGVEDLNKLSKVNEIIDTFVSNGKLVAAICAAPSLVGKLGYYKNHEYTCFPGTEDKIIEGTHVYKPVVRSGNFITAKAMFYSIDFGLEIISYLLGDEHKNITLKKMKGEV